MYAQNNTTPRKCCKSRCFGDTEHCLGVRSSTMQDASSEFRACCAPMYHGCSTSSAKPYSPPARPPAPPRGPFPRSLSLNARSVSRFETLVVPCVPCVPTRVVLQCSRRDSGACGVDDGHTSRHFRMHVCVFRQAQAVLVSHADAYHPTRHLREVAPFSSAATLEINLPHAYAMDSHSRSYRPPNSSVGRQRGQSLVSKHGEELSTITGKDHTFKHNHA